MNKSLMLVSAVGVVLGCAAQSWPDVTVQSRPGTRWWWLGSAVDSADTYYNIGEYARCGIGSVEITPIYGVEGNEANEVAYLTPEWMAQLRHVQNAAAAADMQVDMNQGTGWPFGGPEVTVDDGACKAIFLVDTVYAGSAPVKPLPPKDEGKARIIAQSSRKLPDGREEIIRVYEGRTRQAVKRAAPGGEGLVLDHFNPAAVARYLDKFDKAFTASGNSYPATFFNDSYEVYGANWTPALFEEFEARRGYRLQDRLPELLGFVDDGNSTLSDYRETLSDLLLHNFTEQWVDWAHQRGVKVRNQAHGSPANLIDLYAAVDIPEIEGFGLSDFGIKGLRTDPGFTRKNYSDVSMLKYAPSAAHITGKPLTSSETFTWLTEHFRTSLSQMKPDLDLMFTCGVNRVFFHGTAYSPKDDPWPGWKFYASVDISPTNSIWRDAPAMMDYITRCQSFLQDGKPDNDFLVYLPVRDMWRKRLSHGDKGIYLAFDIHKMDRVAPEFIASVMEIDSLGFDCDYISDRYLMDVTYSDGMLRTGAGTPYKALVVPGSGLMPDAVRARLDSLSAVGAKIIYGVDADALKEAATPEAMRSVAGLRAIRRSDSDGYHYFIANLSPDDVDMTVPLSVSFADALWFDPMTGKVYSAETDNGRVAIRLRSGESHVLRLYDHKVDCGAAGDTPTAKGEPVSLDGPWTLGFVESFPAVDRQWSLDKPEPWTALGDSVLNDLMGTGVYTTVFHLSAGDLDHDWAIELGDVRESARVYVNDSLAGIAWAVPFALDIDRSLLREGDNTLRVEVTNLPANRIAALDRQGVKWRKFKEINVVDINYKKSSYAGWQTVPSGLNSQVTLIRK